MTEPLKIALAGLGTVGVGVIRLIEANAALIARRAGRPLQVTVVSARDRSKPRGVDLSPYAWEDDMVILGERDDVDVVVEMSAVRTDRRSPWRALRSRRARAWSRPTRR